MSAQRDKGKTDDIAFSWGKKRSRGGSNKDVQFYDSFTYDGVEYFLYDSVYLFKKGEAEPYIGKLIKIWENPTKTKKVKVLWFFRPSEIANYLGSENVLENELFLACGEGVGLTNTNPLGAIAGKCNVLCISKDERNRVPSDEEFNTAHYVFYRTFDVERYAISDKLAETIAAIEVSFLLNKKDFQVSDLSPNGEVCKEVMVAGIEKPLLAGKGTLAEGEGMKADVNNGSLSVTGDKDAKEIVDNSNCQPLEQQGDAGLEPATLVALPTKKKVSDSGEENTLRQLVTNQTDVEKVIKTAAHVRPSGKNILVKSKCSESGSLDEGLKDNHLKVAVDTDTNVAKGSISSTMAAEKENSDLVKDSGQLIGCVKRLEGNDNRVPLEGTPSKKLKLDSCASHVKMSAPPSTILAEKRKSMLAKHSDGTRIAMGKKKSIINSHGTSEETPSKKLKLDNTDLSSNNCNNATKISLVRNKSPHPSSGDMGEANDGGKLAKELDGPINGLSKKLKRGGLIDNSNRKLLKSSPEPSKEVEIEAYGCIKEVTRRPADAGRKTYLSWEGKMRAAVDRGTLILLQNLDSKCTSSEVEDIIWHGFKETCTAKMVQRTVTSSPHSGQALVVFLTREAAERVIRKLDQECLMLPNRRPLVAIPWVSNSAEDHSRFPGHLVIDKLKPQMQREAKAVSTSHSSQPNTVEFEMAIEWLLLQDRSDLWWKKLYKQQGVELKKSKACFKTK